MNKFKKVIFVGSGKGGVGKSTVSAGIAVNLAKSGIKVGLLDADIYGPSQDLLMDLKNGTVHNSKEENILPTIESNGVKVATMGALVKDNQALAWRGPMLVSALKQMINQTNWEDTEFLVVDLPPGTGDIVMSLSKMLKADGAIIVSTPQDIALLDAKKAYDMFTKLNIPVIGMVENMSHHICQNCGSKEYIFGEQGLKVFTQKVSSQFLGEIPLNINIRLACDKGKSLTMFNEFTDITKNMLESLEEVGNNPIKVIIE